MVLYVEACESGSMFDGVLRSDINVYATTAANPDESSYACYYDKKRATYLGDRYSVSWLEDSDKVCSACLNLHQSFVFKYISLKHKDFPNSKFSLKSFF